MKLKHLILPGIALLVGIAFQGGVTARPLSEYEQDVESQLREVVETAQGEGYKPHLPRTVGRLAQGAEAPRTVLLRPNWEYNFVAVCDPNCNDVNLIVRDMRGNEITSDVTGDAVAIVTFKPPSEERYQVAVKMQRCSAKQYCNFGLGIFVKN